MGFPSLAGFHNPDLLQAPMVLFDLSTRLGKLQQSQFIHFQIVDSLVLCRTNLGNDLKSTCNSSQDVLSGCLNVSIPNGHSWSCHHLAFHRSCNRTESGARHRSKARQQVDLFDYSVLSLPDHM